MPLDTFNPPVPPVVSGLEVQREPRILLASFGDGYEQRASDGLNADRKMVTLNWRDLSVADANAIDIFLSGKGGVTAFLWTRPRGSAPEKWTCPNWSRREFDNADLDSITATFREAFDLD